MSATRPCCEFSIGMIALPAAPERDRVERVLEREARQRQAIGRPFERGAVRVGARRALERDRARGVGGGGVAHRFDQREGGGGEAVHRALRGNGAARGGQVTIGLAPLRTPTLERRANPHTWQTILR